MHDSFSQTTSVEHSVMDLIVDQLEELVVTLVEEIRERPGVAAAILAAVVGALAGATFAARVSRKRSSATWKVAKRVRGATEMADLAGLGLKLLQNPLVRDYIRLTVERQLKKRFPN